MTRPDELQVRKCLDYLLKREGWLEIPLHIPCEVLYALLDSSAGLRSSQAVYGLK